MNYVLPLLFLLRILLNEIARLFLFPTCSFQLCLPICLPSARWEWDSLSLFRVGGPKDISHSFWLRCWWRLLLPLFGRRGTVERGFSSAKGSFSLSPQQTCVSERIMLLGNFVPSPPHTLGTQTSRRFGIWHWHRTLMVGNNFPKDSH